MSLETLLNSAKWVDGQVLRQYTIIGRKFNLDEGRRKYFAGMSLWIAHNVFSAGVFPQFMELRALLCVLDFNYNLNGIYGRIKDETTSEAMAINRSHYVCRSFNSGARLPIFMLGVGLIGKFGMDLFNYMTNGEPIGSNSYDCLMYGVGALSLASSMYIKETDPKLLDKEPFWKKAYNWAKEKFGSLAPQPAPQPGFAGAYSIENCIEAQ